MGNILIVPHKTKPAGYLLLFAILISFLIISYFLPLLSYQEARRAVIIQESFLNKSIVPTLNGEPYFTEPPLHIWISFLFYGIAGIFKAELFGMRLVSIISYLLIAYLIYLIQKRDTLKTLLSVLILTSSHSFLSFMYRIDIEPLFIFFNFASFYFFLQFLEDPRLLRVLQFYFFFACAFLVRGPLHFFLLPAYFLFLLLQKDRKKIFLFMHPACLFLFIGLLIPWFLYGYVKFGKEVFQEFLYKDLGDRLVAKKEPFYYYFKTYILNWLPILLLVLFKIKTLREFLKNRTSQLFKVSFLSVLIPLILLSFTGDKFHKYLLFLYPYSALIFAEILLLLYPPKRLLQIASFITLINALVLLIILFNKLQKVKEDSQILIEALKGLKEERIVFYEKPNLLLLYHLKMPIPVVKTKDGVEEALKKGKFVLSPRIIEEMPSYIAVYPDPFKKGSFWFLYGKME
ncbi:MAG: ArnT family glycosyltransferase [Caldimicrobium sp.]